LGILSVALVGKRQCCCEVNTGYARGDEMLEDLAYGDYTAGCVAFIYLMLFIFLKEKAESKDCPKTVKILVVFAYVPVILFTTWTALVFMLSFLLDVWSFILLIFN
jgi:hypothetical protein